jgi:hypothetical protein
MPTSIDDIPKPRRTPRTLLRSILMLDDTPHSVALGTAIGMFVGMTPTVGIQMIIVLIVAFLTRPFLKFNKIAAVLTDDRSDLLVQLQSRNVFHSLVSQVRRLRRDRSIRQSRQLVRTSICSDYGTRGSTDCRLPACRGGVQPVDLPRDAMVASPVSSAGRFR